MNVGIELTLEEIHAAFPAEARAAAPAPILTPAQFAALAGLPLKTVYAYLENGQMHGCHRRRGKHQLIWRDRAIQALFNGTDFSSCAPTVRCGGTGIGLSPKEIQNAFSSDSLRNQFPAILNPEQLGALVGIKRSSIYFWIAKGHFESQGALKGAVAKRGKRQFVWRDRAVLLLFNGYDWEETHG
jgi:hypothetical protein